MTDDLERAIGPDRRTFVKRLVMGTAFASPIVSSFTMSGVHAVFGDTPGSAITGLGNCNTVISPTNFPDELICELFDADGGTLEVDDGDVHIALVIPPGAFNTTLLVCIFKGDLAALASEVPSGETPISAYGVAWGVCRGDALLPLVMTVTGAPVAVGNPIYMLDKATGEPEQVGTVAVAGTWAVSFTEDPGFVVTDALAPPAPSPTPASPGTAAPGAAPGGAAPATPVAGQPGFTG